MAKFGVKDVLDVTIIDLTTLKPVMILDSLKISNLMNSASESHASGGRGNARLLTWDFDRVAELDCQDALIDPRSLAMLSGNPLVTGITPIYGKERVIGVAGTATNTKLALVNTPLAGTISVFTNVDGDNIGIEVTPPSIVAGGVEVPTVSLAIGVYAWVFYQYSSTAQAQLVSITSDKFPGFYKIIGDTLVKNETTTLMEPFQLVIHKAKLMPGFTLKLEAVSDPSVFDFKLQIYRPADKAEMIQLIKY